MVQEDAASQVESSRVSRVVSLEACIVGGPGAISPLAFCDTFGLEPAPAPAPAPAPGRKGRNYGQRAGCVHAAIDYSVQGC